MAACLVPAVVAGPGELQRCPEPLPGTDYVRLGTVENGQHDLDRVTLDTGLGAFGQHLLVGFEEFGPAVGISGVVDHVGSDVDPVGIDGFAESGCDAQEHDVPGRNVGYGDVLRQVPLAVHGDVYVLAGEGRTERREVEVDDDVVHIVVLADILGRGQLPGVPLTVSETERGDLASVLDGLGQGSGRIESSGKEYDSLLGHFSSTVYQAV